MLLLLVPYRSQDSKHRLGSPGGAAIVAFHPGCTARTMTPVLDQGSSLALQCAGTGVSQMATPEGTHSIIPEPECVSPPVERGIGG